MADLFHAALRDARSGRFESAEANLTQFLSGRVSRDAEASACALLGFVEFYLGKIDEAVKSLQRSVHLRGNNADAHSNLCSALRLQGKNLGAAIWHGRKAVALRPGFPEGLLNLGNALEEKGALDDAISLYKRALAKRPGYPEALFGLGNTLGKRGEYAAAVAAYRGALAAKPGFADAQLNLGGALEAIGDLAEAINAYRVALELQPDFLAAWQNLGNLLQMTGETESAIEAFDRALAVDPGFSEAHLGRGNALENRGDSDGALAAYRQAVATRPEFAEAYINLGNLLEESGDQDGAVDAYNRALSIRPDFAEAHRFLSLCLSYHEGDPHLVKLRSLHKRKASIDDRIHLNFALAKAEEDCGNFDSAFARYAEANALRHRMTAYDPETGRVRRENILRLDDRMREAAVTRVAAASDPHGVFIVGLPRCGSTLVENIVSLNPAVVKLGEIEALAKAVAASGLLKSEPDMKALETIRDRYYAAALPEKAQVKIFTDKMLGNFQYCGLIARAWPTARIVHMVRNPLDNIMSIYRNYFVTGQAYAYDLDEIIDHYHAHMQMMAAWKERYGDRIFTCDYDRLVSDSGQGIRALVDFCGFEWDEMYLEPHRNRRRVKTASMAQVRRPIYATSVKGWRKYEKYLKPVAERLRELGYVID